MQNFFSVYTVTVERKFYSGKPHQKRSLIIEKGDVVMATSTFDRKIEITDPESVKKLISIMSEDTPGSPLSKHPYSEADRERGVQLLKQCLSHSRA